MDLGSARETGGSVRPEPGAFARVDGGAVRVLAVDDEPQLTEAISCVLAAQGWDVRVATNGRAAVQMAEEFRPDAVVLDVMLPDIDGYQVLRALRAHSATVCVLFLTARDEVEDRIRGIDLGADDYLTKPFSLAELTARVRGLLRRANMGVDLAPAGRMITVDDLTLDEDACEVRRGAQVIELSATEFKLLRLLMQNPRRVLSRADILEQVWQYDFGGRSHIVELYISYLRRKIDDGRTPLIHTVRGSGYVLKPPGQ